MTVHLHGADAGPATQRHEEGYSRARLCPRDTLTTLKLGPDDEELMTFVALFNDDITFVQPKVSQSTIHKNMNVTAYALGTKNNISTMTRRRRQAQRPGRKLLLAQHGASEGRRSSFSRLNSCTCDRTEVWYSQQPNCTCTAAAINV